MTAEQVRQLLRKQCERAGSQIKWATQNGMSGVYVSDTLAGHKEPAGKLLAALGVERVISYRKARACKEQQK